MANPLKSFMGGGTNPLGGGYDEPSKYAHEYAKTA